MSLATLFIITDAIAIALTAVAVAYMIKIARVTGWFRAWYVLSAAFTLIVVRRTLAWLAPFTAVSDILNYLNSTLLLILSVLYVIAFHELYTLFLRKQHKRR